MMYVERWLLVIWEICVILKFLIIYLIFIIRNYDVIGLIDIVYSELCKSF